MLIWILDWPLTSQHALTGVTSRGEELLFAFARDRFVSSPGENRAFQFHAASSKFSVTGEWCPPQGLVSYSQWGLLGKDMDILTNNNLGDFPTASSEFNLIMFFSWFRVLDFDMIKP